MEYLNKYSDLDKIQIIHISQLYKSYSMVCQMIVVDEWFSSLNDDIKNQYFSRKDTDDISN